MERVIDEWSSSNGYDFITTEDGNTYKKIWDKLNGWENINNLTIDNTTKGYSFN